MVMLKLVPVLKSVIPVIVELDDLLLTPPPPIPLFPHIAVQAHQAIF